MLPSAIRREPVFPKVNTPYGQALTGLKVLKLDGAIAPRVLKFDSGFAAEGCGGRLLIDRRRPLIIKTLQPPWGRWKTGQPRSARENAFPLWWLAPPPCPVGSMSLDSRVAYSSPMNPVPLPPPTSWGHYKAPLCCELLMKGLLFRALFCPRLRGKSGAAG